MNKEFFEFLTGKETPPKALSLAAQKDISLSFRARSIVGKFLFWQFLGALFSMSVCPQFGLGLAEGHGISHAFRMVGDGACAMFCASLFLTSGTIMAFIGMKGEELWWVWRRYKFILVFLPAALWALLMLGNGLNISTEPPTYHLIWLATAMMVQALWMQMRSFAYNRI